MHLKRERAEEYEFGNKVSIVCTLNTGVIVGAMGFRNVYDGHTLERALDQHEKLSGKQVKSATVDWGYRGRIKIGETMISIPKPFNNKKSSQHMQTKLRKGFKRRAAIEPVIRHLKTDHRLGRNFYKGIFGDNINIMLATAAYNFKRMMNKWKSSLLDLFFSWLKLLIFIFKESLEIQMKPEPKQINSFKSKWAF